MRPNSECVQSNFISRTLKGFNRIAPGATRGIIRSAKQP